MFQWIHNRLINYFPDMIHFHLMAELVMDGWWWLMVVDWLVVVWELPHQAQEVFQLYEQ